MDLLHQSGEVSGGIILVDGLVEGDKRVFYRALAFDREDFIDGALAGGEAIVFDSLEGGDIGFGAPDRRLGDAYFLRGEDGGKNERKAEKDC